MLAIANDVRGRDCRALVKLVSAFIDSLEAVCAAAALRVLASKGQPFSCNHLSVVDMAAVRCELTDSHVQQEADLVHPFQHIDMAILSSC